MHISAEVVQRDFFPISIDSIQKKKKREKNLKGKILGFMPKSHSCRNTKRSSC